MFEYTIEFLRVIDRDNQLQGEKVVVVTLCLNHGDKVNVILVFEGLSIAALM